MLSFLVHRMDIFLFTKILDNFPSSELHCRLQCTETWVWPLQTDLRSFSLQLPAESDSAAARKSPNLLVWRFADHQWKAKMIQHWKIKLVKTNSSENYFNYQTYSLKLLFLLFFFCFETDRIRGHGVTVGQVLSEVKGCSVMEVTGAMTISGESTLQFF